MTKVKATTYSRPDCPTCPSLNNCPDGAKFAPYPTSCDLWLAGQATCPATKDGHSCMHRRAKHPPYHEDLNGWCWRENEP